jgi:2-C-methyl-D-erythritol 4-phosphate cytidylyltransferase
MQTPQVFMTEMIKTALTRAQQKGIRTTDDCSAVEAMGYKVTIVAGDPDNIKLTTARDLYIAEGILAERKGR